MVVAFFVYKRNNALVLIISIKNLAQINNLSITFWKNKQFYIVLLLFVPSHIVWYECIEYKRYFSGEWLKRSLLNRYHSRMNYCNPVIFYLCHSMLYITCFWSYRYENCNYVNIYRIFFLWKMRYDVKLLWFHAFKVISSLCVYMGWNLIVLFENTVSISNRLVTNFSWTSDVIIKI